MQINDFYAWFNNDSPNFSVKSYGAINSFYDKETDTFMIEEIQAAYEQFKNGEQPNSLYSCWGIIK